ncbi:hypothetical protein HDU98_006017 [Podochytrium sp. JEL0797]|nr:hypothetical protein HDU98_006017 [Podochytrium sp. JEL0797]
MTASCLLFALLLTPFLATVSAFYNDNGNNNFTFYARQAPKNNSIVCILGQNVTANTYIGFGIPSSPDHPYMLGSDITVVYGNGTGNSTGVVVVHGRGMAADGPYFLADVDSQDVDVYESLLGELSYFDSAASKLKVCFKRPNEVAVGVGRNLTAAPST